MNNMPMPGQPSKEEKEAPELSVPENKEEMQSPVIEKDEEKSEPSNEVDQKPSIDTHENSNNSVVEVAQMSKSGIEVVATRAGFYNQNRIKAGHEFKVSSFEALGEWMSCKDPVLEKKRVQFFKDKKKAIK